METPQEDGTSNQVLGLSIAKLKIAMPKSSLLQVKVLLALVQSLSPRRRKNIFFEC